MYSKEELISKPIEELETIARTLGSDLSAADGAEALVNFIVGDFSEEEEKPKKKASTKKAEKAEGEEPVVKKKRGRPSKADLAARAAEEALKNLNNTETATTEQPAELPLGFTEETASQPSEEDNTANVATGEDNNEEAAPKKKRSRRSKEEIFAAAQAKAAALAANNQKKQELEDKVARAAESSPSGFVSSDPRFRFHPELMTGQAERDSAAGARDRLNEARVRAGLEPLPDEPDYDATSKIPASKDPLWQLKQEQQSKQSK